jgi:hypothetical protein
MLSGIAARHHEAQLRRLPRRLDQQALQHRLPIGL